MCFKYVSSRISYCRCYKTLRNIDTHKLGSAKEVIIFIKLWLPLYLYFPLPFLIFLFLR